MRPTIRRRILALSFSLLTAFGCASNASLKAFGQDPPWKSVTARYARSRNFDLIHSLIRVRFDEATKTVFGEVTHTLKPMSDDLSSITLDAVKLNVTNVVLKSGKALKFHTSLDHLDIDLDRGYKTGEQIEIVITYSTVSPQKGMYFIRPDPAYPNRPAQIWSQGESEETRHWQPTYDEPNDKATTEIYITTLSKYTAIANGALIDTKDNGDGTRTWHWREDKPHSTYLTSIAIGDYAEVKQESQPLNVRYYIYPSKQTEGDMLFKKTPQIIDYFSKQIGYQYPYEKYSQIVAADFAGSMENISATTHTDQLLHDKRTHQDITYEDYVSHELAHQWWGDLLTCRDWSDIWLNEGFATYFEKVWTEHDLGPDDGAYWKIDYQDQYLKEESQYKRPIVYHYYTSPDDMFDRTTYAKGGLVLNMLRFVLGDAQFWKALNYYAHKFEYQNVDTHEFQIAIQESTGQNLQWFFDEWLYHAGHPDFEVTEDWDSAAKSLKLTVKQTQKVDDVTPLFTMPIDIEIVTESGRKTNRVTVDKQNQDFYFPMDSRPLMVVFDKGDRLLKTLKFNKSKEELIYQLKNDTDINGRGFAAQGLAEFGSDEAVIKALKDALLADKYWYPSSEAAEALGNLKSQAALAVLVDGYKSPNSKVRRAVVTALGNYSIPQVVDLLQKAINSDSSYYTQAAAITSVAKIGGDRAFDIVSSGLKLDSFREIVRQASLTGLATLKDPQAIPVLTEYLKYGQPKVLRITAVRGLVELGSGNEKVGATLIPFLADDQDTMRAAVAGALADLGVEAALEPLTTMSEHDPSDDVKAAAKAALAKLTAKLKD